MEKALIIIDYTNDFIADDGILTCGKPGQKIESYITECIKDFGVQKEFIAFVNDIHFEDDTYHPENRLFPIHNLFQSEGRQLYGTVGREFLMRCRMNNVREIDKTRYSAFAGTNLDILLRERNIKEIHLVGVCTDICILHTAIDGYNRGFDIVVHKNGVASFDIAGHQWALHHMENILGATIV